MNLTIAVDDKVLERARMIARRRGVSLQELLRQMIESLAGARTAEENAAELIALLRSSPGRSDGRKWSREEIYDRQD